MSINSIETSPMERPWAAFALAPGCRTEQRISETAFLAVSLMMAVYNDLVELGM